MTEAAPPDDASKRRCRHHTPVPRECPANVVVPTIAAAAEARRKRHAESVAARQQRLRRRAFIQHRAGPPSIATAVAGAAKRSDSTISTPAAIAAIRCHNAAR